MVEVIIWYLLFGIGFHFFLTRLLGKLEIEPLEGGEHFHAIVFWPIGLTFFLFSFIKGLIQNRDE